MILLDTQLATIQHLAEQGDVLAAAALIAYKQSSGGGATPPEVLDVNGEGNYSVDVTKRTTFIKNPAVSEVSVVVPDGTVAGQRKTISAQAGFTIDSNTVNLIFDNIYLEGGNAARLQEFADGVEIEWDGSTWCLIALYGGATIVSLG